MQSTNPMQASEVSCLRITNVPSDADDGMVGFAFTFFQPSGTAVGIAQFYVKSHGARSAPERAYLTENLTQILIAAAKASSVRFCVVDDWANHVDGFRVCFRSAICAAEMERSQNDPNGPPRIFLMDVQKEDLPPQPSEVDPEFCKLTMLL